MDSNNIKNLFDSPSSISILSTVAPEGSPNSAIFGSTQLIADQVVIACGNNRTVKNLQHNCKAHLLITIPGETILTFSGLRLQLSCAKIENSGPQLEKIRTEVRKMPAAQQQG